MTAPPHTSSSPEHGPDGGDAGVPDVDAEAVVALTQALVRLPTVNAEGAAVVEQPAADLVAEVMRGFGWQVHVAEVAPGRPNVVGVVQGRPGGPTVMFEGHTDVVTAGDPALWSFDPFAGDIVDGRLRGRGSADMKSGVAAMIHAARAVELAGFAGRILVAALADEEGMMLGAKYFAAHQAAALAPEGIAGVIVCEPEAGEVCTVAKGAMRLLVHVHGVMAHGAMPQHGRNPLPAVGAFLVGMSALQDRLTAEFGDHPLLGRVFVTPTVLAAGDPAQINVIPALATVALDIRTVPGVDHAELLSTIGALAERVAGESGLRAELVVVDDRPPVDTPESEPVVAALRAAHREVTGVEAAIGGVPGTTDGTILTRDAGLATVVYGPGGKWIAHQADEFVEVAEIVQACRVFAAAARRLLVAA
ncbi:M20 family metallopeptidase [Nakamurella endophytica]|uniref:Probable succinyl-diaminopimelate desuccinylase n=1 Tax=Nakamurella endophytica TaxID=1748367 RepID=A0A917SQE4_9ACTN|nr:M20 family metallopeptidase [Nakamurella endophytica]GGL93549.1 peptidase M20 [Nakamurella endophytica]